MQENQNKIIKNTKNRKVTVAAAEPPRVQSGVVVVRVLVLLGRFLKVMRVTRFSRVFIETATNIITSNNKNRHVV